MASLPLYIDIVNKQLVTSYRNGSPLNSVPNFFQNDTVTIQLHFLQPTGDITFPFSYVDFSGSTTKLGMGTIDATPTAGTYTLTFGANTTTAIAYNAAASAVASALNALASIISAGGVTVSLLATGQYQVTFTTPAVTGLISGTATGLAPQSNVVVSRLITGSASVSEIQKVKLLQIPAVYQNSWSNVSAPTVSVSTLQGGGGGYNEVQKVLIGGFPIGGTFSLIFSSNATSPLVYNATAPSVQSALEAVSGIGSGNVSVSGQTGGPYFISFIGSLANTNVAQLVSDASGLIGPTALTADVALNTAGVDSLIGTSANASATLEIEVTPSGGSPTTYIQRTITLVNDLIDDSATVPTPTASYYTTAEVLALIKGTASATTEAAKTNIGSVTDTVTVVFGVTKSSANWHFLGRAVRNTTDASPLVIDPGILTARSTTGFTVKLPANTDSSNYYYEWHVVLD